MQWPILALLAAAFLLAGPLRVLAGPGDPALGFQALLALAALGLWIANVVRGELDPVTWGAFACAAFAFVAMAAELPRLLAAPLGRSRSRKLLVTGGAAAQLALFGAAGALAALVGLGTVAF